MSHEEKPPKLLSAPAGDHWGRCVPGPRPGLLRIGPRTNATGGREEQQHRTLGTQLPADAPLVVTLTAISSALHNSRALTPAPSSGSCSTPLPAAIGTPAPSALGPRSTRSATVRCRARAPPSVGSPTSTQQPTPHLQKEVNLTFSPEMNSPVTDTSFFLHNSLTLKEKFHK